MEGEGACTRQIEYSMKCPLSAFASSSVQKGGAYLQELTVLTLEEIWTVLTMENLVEHIMLTFLCQKFKLYSFLH